MRVSRFRWHALDRVIMVDYVRPAGFAWSAGWSPTAFLRTVRVSDERTGMKVYWSSAGPLVHSDSFVTPRHIPSLHLLSNSTTNRRASDS